MANAVSWFEIPTTDFQRAIKFYNTILEITLHSMEMGQGMLMAMFPAEGGVGGTLVHHENYKPSFDGSTVYLTVEKDLAVTLAKIEELGGTVVIPKTSLGEEMGGGFFAQFIDSEGNRVGLFSM